MSNRIFVRPLLPAKVVLVSYATTHIRPDGSSFDQANPHLMILCPDDLPPYVEEHRSTGSKFRPPVLPKRGEVLEYMKRGRKQYIAEKMETKFPILLKAEPLVNLVRYAKPDKHSADGEERWIEVVGVDNKFMFTIHSVDDREEYIFLKENADIFGGERWRITAASMLYGEHARLPKFELAQPKPFPDPDDEMRISVLRLPGSTAKPNNPWHVENTRISEGKLEICLIGQPGDWRIEDPKTGERFIGHGDKLPDGYAPW